MGFQVRICRAVLCGLVATLFLPSPSAAETTLVSREGQPPGTTGRGYASSLSGDGRFVGFWDGGLALVRDLPAGTTVVASRASGAQGAIADASLFPPSLSTDGRFVAFTSPAPTLDPDDGDDAPDVFVRDLSKRRVEPVRRGPALGLGFPQEHFERPLQLLGCFLDAQPDQAEDEDHLERSSHRSTSAVPDSAAITPIR